MKHHIFTHTPTGQQWGLNAHSEGEARTNIALALKVSPDTLAPLTAFDVESAPPVRTADLFETRASRVR
jgi:hypothetical protein